jgi:hypothetical protein
MTPCCRERCDAVSFFSLFRDPDNIQLEMYAPGQPAPTRRTRGVHRAPTDSLMCRCDEPTRILGALCDSVELYLYPE